MVWMCCSRLFLVVIFGGLSWCFLWVVFGTLLLGICWGKFVGTLRGSLGCDSSPKSVSKGARFSSFPSSRVRGVLGGISSIPPFWISFGGIKLGYGLLMTCSYPKVLFKSVERFGRSKFGFGGVDSRVLFIPSCPGYTGLTGALDWSDWCIPRWVFAQVNV
jgi:hypothetical protein